MDETAIQLIYTHVMTVHFLKPALRTHDIYDFAARQQQWYTHHDGLIVYPVWTSRRPARQKELLDGGSVYWIVKNQVQCRQDIWDIKEVHDDQDSKPSYLLLCNPALIRTEGLPRRAFQGWRYLEPDAAPRDLGALAAGDVPPPDDMEPDLRAAGLL